MPLLGRVPKLKELVELVDAPAGRSGAIIRGESGIGKSALVRELATWVLRVVTPARRGSAGATTIPPFGAVPGGT